MPQTLWPKQTIDQQHSINKGRPYLEHLDEKENLGVFEIDGPTTRNARDDGVDE